MIDYYYISMMERYKIEIYFRSIKLETFVIDKTKDGSIIQIIPSSFMTSMVDLPSKRFPIMVLYGDLDNAPISLYLDHYYCRVM
jgi:hypothetical protein